MRYKAISDDYGKNAKRNQFISLAISFMLIAILLVLVRQQIMKPEFEPVFYVYMIIGYSVLAFPNAFWFAFSSVQLTTIKTVGRSRYITLGKDGLLLEDILDDRKFEHFYTWKDIENILIQNNTPFDKFNKNKTLIITFIINQAEYNYFITRSKFRTSKMAEYINSFFTVMYSKELLDEIRKNRVGTIEDLSGQSILLP